jgi:hypothetical protein
VAMLTGALSFRTGALSNERDALAFHTEARTSSRASRPHWTRSSRIERVDPMEPGGAVVRPPTSIARDFIDYPWFSDSGAVQALDVTRGCPLVANGREGTGGWGSSFQEQHDVHVLVWARPGP